MLLEERHLSFHIDCEKSVYLLSEFLAKNNVPDIRLFFLKFLGGNRRSSNFDT